MQRTRADLAVSFINRLTLWGDYAGHPFHLRDWQVQIVRAALDDVTRKLFLFIGRKQAKTTLCSAIMAYLLVGEGTQRELYSAAADRDQAAIAYRAMKAMLQADEYLASICTFTDSLKRIECTANGNVYRALSADANTKAGYRPNVVLLDELAFHPSRDLHDILTSGYGATKKPLTLIVSTAGPDKSNLCREEFEYAKRVRDGIVTDPTYKPFLFYAEPNENWKDEKVWQRCMPALGDFCELDFIRNECRQAQEIATREHTFRTLYLNTWLSDSAAWVPDQKWQACLVKEGWDQLKGKKAWGGL